MAPLIKVENLIKKYGNSVVLDSISLDVSEGEFVALLGPSGCGKTTLLRSIAGFIEPSSGIIEIGGASMNGLPPNRRPVNMVFQNYALFPHLNVGQNVAFGPHRRKEAPARIDQLVRECLATVGMSAFAERMPSQLSGGQQQRVALARAIANKPKVLLLDEPLGALDFKLRKQMQVELKQLQKNLGITFILVTHDQEEALVMADRIVVMNHGRIEQIGAGHEIYMSPRNRYVADFIGEANLIPCLVDGSGRLALPSGEALPYSLPPGAGKAHILLRPEHLAIGEVRDDDVSLSAVVTNKSFVGNTTRIYAQVPAGDFEILASVTDIGAASRLQLGETITVSWKRDAAHVLAD